MKASRAGPLPATRLRAVVGRGRVVARSYGAVVAGRAARVTNPVRAV
ncbi:MAG: hypothetical protein ACJ72D_02225 [Marmoricola sp.]